MGVFFKVFKNSKVHVGIKRAGWLYYTLLTYIQTKPEKQSVAMIL